MEHFLQVHQQIRANLRDVLLKTTVEDLFIIPDGFNNHIFWNIAHCVATQQLLHYYLTGNDFRIDRKWVDFYKKGTFPSFNETEDDIEDLAFILKSTREDLVEDYQEGIFTDYQPYSTSFGLDLKNINDAIVYNNIHESLHLGYVLAQKRALLG